MKEMTISKKVLATLMSAALVVAFAPALAAPQAAKAYTSADKKGAIAYINTWVGKNEKITLNAAKKIVAYFDNELLDRLDDMGNPLDAEIVAMKTWSEDAIKKINQTQAQLNAIRITNLSASKDMLRTNLTWKTVNPQKTKDIYYQYKYRIGKADYKKIVNVEKVKKNTDGFYYTSVENLKADKTYTFKVRVAKKVYGETLHSPYSKTASVKVLPKYKKGKYKVNEKTIRVYKKASTKSGRVSLYKTLVKGKKVKITKVKVSRGEVWGYAKFKQIRRDKSKTFKGWVQMAKLKKA